MPGLTTRLQAFVRDDRASAVRWFAYAAAAITMTAAVGTYGMAWLITAHRQPSVAFLPLNGPAAATPSFGDPDMAATASLPGEPRSPHR